jgi:hypothetical protein
MHAAHASTPPPQLTERSDQDHQRTPPPKRHLSWAHAARNSGNSHANANCGVEVRVAGADALMANAMMKATIPSRSGVAICQPARRSLACRAVIKITQIAPSGPTFSSEKASLRSLAVKQALRGPDAQSCGRHREGGSREPWGHIRMLPVGGCSM